jgi:S1-C subfamily serine protease
VVSAVSPGSPAAAAGLLAEDRVVSVDGTAVADRESYLLALSGKRWGDGVALVVERAGKRFSATVPLRRSSAAAPPPAR